MGTLLGRHPPVSLWSERGTIFSVLEVAAWQELHPPDKSAFKL